jgi:hypothetical protein
LAPWESKTKVNFRAAFALMDFPGIFSPMNFCELCLVQAIEQHELRNTVPCLTIRGNCFAPFKIESWNDMVGVREMHGVKRQFAPVRLFKGNGRISEDSRK